jgi:hypothetical protein
MIIAILKLVVRLHAWLVAGTEFEFRIVPRDMRDFYYVRGWGLAHHVVEGKNGGELLIPRTKVFFPEMMWKDWTLIYRPKYARRKRRSQWNRR